MSYLVMESHPGYAVVLDEKGRFLRAANPGYEVGQTVRRVILLEEKRRPAVPLRLLSAAGAAAACLILMFTAVFGYLGDPGSPYASVYIRINPEVRLDVDRNDRVVAAEGVNEDGVLLLEGYEGYEKKPLETVAEELMDRAAGMGFLSPGGRVSLYLETKDAAWAERVGRSLDRSLNSAHTDLTIVVELTPPESSPESAESSSPESTENRVSPGGEVTLPFERKDSSDYGMTDYGITDYGDTGYSSSAPQGSATDYGTGYDTDYGPGSDGVTDYGSDYGSSDYGNTDYSDTDYSKSDYGGSDYTGYE